jgi:hypothetical protein
MDEQEHEIHESFIKRFRELSAEFERIHEAWQEARHNGDLDRQSVLTSREHDIVMDIHTVIAAFQQLIPCCYPFLQVCEIFPYLPPIMPPPPPPRQQLQPDDRPYRSDPALPSTKLPCIDGITASLCRQRGGL